MAHSTGQLQVIVVEGSEVILGYFALKCCSSMLVGVIQAFVNGLAV